MATETATGTATEQAADEDGVSGGEHAEEHGHGVAVVVEPGQTASITFTLPADRAGEWTMGCFQESGTHFDQGMEGTITVTR